MILSTNYFPKDSETGSYWEKTWISEGKRSRRREFHWVEPFKEDWWLQFFLFFPDPWGDDSQFDGSHIFFNWVGWNHQLVENLRRIVCFLLRPRLSIQNFSHPSKTNDMTIAGRNSRIWMSRWQWYYFLLKNSVDFPASHSLVFRESGTFRRFGSPLSREILEIWLLDLGWVPPHEHIIVWTCIFIYLYIKIRMFLGHVFHDEFFPS